MQIKSTANIDEQRAACDPQFTVYKISPIERSSIDWIKVINLQFN